LGTLFYGAQPIAIRVDDVLLRHLELVITSKLRRGEGLVISWHDERTTGDGRSTVWLHPSIELHYRYSGSREPQVNRELLEELAAAAGSNRGVRITVDGHVAGTGQAQKAESSPESADPRSDRQQSMSS
jgi:hypothetical protein